MVRWNAGAEQLGYDLLTSDMVCRWRHQETYDVRNVFRRTNADQPRNGSLLSKTQVIIRKQSPVSRLTSAMSRLTGPPVRWPTPSSMLCPGRSHRYSTSTQDTTAYHSLHMLTSIGPGAYAFALML
jgi:hypothetical protein